MGPLGDAADAGRPRWVPLPKPQHVPDRKRNHDRHRQIVIDLAAEKLGERARDRAHKRRCNRAPAGDVRVPNRQDGPRRSETHNRVSDGAFERAVVDELSRAESAADEARCGVAKTDARDRHSKRRKGKERGDNRQAGAKPRRRIDRVRFVFVGDGPQNPHENGVPCGRSPAGDFKGPRQDGKRRRECDGTRRAQHRFEQNHHAKGRKGVLGRAAEVFGTRGSDMHEKIVPLHCHGAVTEAVTIRPVVALHGKFATRRRLDRPSGWRPKFASSAPAARAGGHQVAVGCAPMMLFAWLLACDVGTIPLDGGEGEAGPSISAAPAFDPFAGAAWTFTVLGTETADARVVDSAGLTVRTTVGTAGWDGKNDAGEWVATGNYQLVVGDDEVSADVAVVRPGLIAAYAEDDGGVTAERVPLFWHRAGVLQDVAEPIAETTAIDELSGVRIELPDTTAQVDRPEPGFAEPIAYRFDSRPILTVQLGQTSVLGTANLAGAELRVVADGWTVLDDAALVDGGTVTLQRNESLGTTVGISDEVVVLRVVAADVAGTEWTVSEMDFSARFLRVLAPPTWDLSTAKYSAWVAAVVPALEGIEGTVATHDAVLSALVRWVYEDSGLSYDSEYGASAYTNYPRGDWEAAQFDMTSFLDRRFGTVVNCSDCAGIIVAYSNMLGAVSDYAIIGSDFDLDYILAIGADEFTRCPFGRGGCGFSYHAVAVSPAGDLIWDATLALDGDDDSESTPNSLLMVEAIAAEEYLERLASTRAAYTHQAQGTLQ